MNHEQIIYLPLERVEVALQVRREFSEETLRGLMETLLTVGQLAPIRVRKEGDLYVIVDGERRYRAAKLAGFTTIAAIVEEQELAPAAIQQRQLVANFQRDNLTPMETATAIAELMNETGCTATEVAFRLGMSNATVSKLLALVKLPDAIQSQICSGAIPASAGYELGKIEDAAEQGALAAQIANGEIRRDELSGIVKRRQSPQSSVQPGLSTRVRVELSNGRTIMLAGAGLDSLAAMICWLEELLRKARKLRPKGLELGECVRLLKDQAKA